MKKYKYVHLLWQGGPLFNKRIVEMITDPENGFSVDEHLFVTPYESIFNEVRMYPNVVFEQMLRAQSADLVNKYAEYGQWVFLHGMCGIFEAVKIKRKHQRKIIWRTWGHDVHWLACKRHDLIGNLAKRMLNACWKAEVRRFQLVGGANIVDEIALRKKFGKLEFKQIDYPAKDNLKWLDQAKEKYNRSDSSVRILIGHSGIESDNHIEIIDKLKRLYNNDISMVFVLSYGDDSYIEKVKKYIQENCREKSEILETPMPFEEYVQMLADVDVAVLDGTASYALSNISILLYLGKTLFLNREGILAEAFYEEKIPFCYTDELDHISFADLSRPAISEKLSDKTLLPTGYKDAVKRWHRLLDWLN